MTDLNPQALCTSPNCLGSSSYLTSFCVGLGAKWGAWTNPRDCGPLLPPPSSPPWCFHPPQPFYPMASSECVGSSLLRTECVLGVTAFSRNRPWPQSFLASGTSEFGVQKVDSSLWWRGDSALSKVRSHPLPTHQKWGEWLIGGSILYHWL